MTITATEFKTNLGKYIDIITKSGEEITVTKNGKKVLQIARPKIGGAEKLADLVKSSKHRWDYDKLKKGAMEEKYEITL